MPRRKNKECDVAVPAVKRQRRGNAPAPGGSTVEYLWQWEEDGGTWTEYCQQLQAHLTACFEGDQAPVTFEATPKVQLNVDVVRMIQKNKKSGWERRLRMAIKLKTPSESAYHVWQWEDEHSHMNPYDGYMTVLLEKAHSHGDSEVKVTAANRSYTVSLSDMQQTNDKTGVKRKVERIQISHSDPPLDTVQILEATNGSTAKSAGNKAAAAKSGQSSANKKTKSAASRSTGPAGEASAPAKSSVKTIVMKGAAPVDPECTKKVNTAHVYSQGKDVYDTMLNQTNLSNNNNKYYLMQVLEDDTRKVYSVWYRWGRVGYNGQTTLIPCGPNLDEAINTFTKKFYDKTKNDWATRNKFQKVAGKYDMVKVDYSAEAPKESDEARKPENVPDSKLEKRLQSLIELICDVKKMEEAVVEMKYDAKKAPLGKLTEAQIKAGYKALKKIDNLIESNDFSSRLVQACDEFYTRIPHDFGMRVPPVIRSKADVRLKLSLLEALSDIEVAMKIIRQSNVDENPVDTHYNSLRCQLHALDRAAPDFQMLEDYLKNSHARTHNQYKMTVLDAFDVRREEESKRFVDKGNRVLLWHGSRLTNWVGILSQGLRIAPPEAPVTGYMFGKGVYFADMSSKSANYCYPTQAKDEGLVLLCEVSLGSCNELLAADYRADQLPADRHSVWGKGSIAPDPKRNFTMSNGCIVPLGKAKDTGVKNPGGYTLNYNEFIVYNLQQIKMKYLLRIKFDFK